MKKVLGDFVPFKVNKSRALIHRYTGDKIVIGVAWKESLDSKLKKSDILLSPARVRKLLPQSCEKLRVLPCDESSTDFIVFRHRADGTVALQFHSRYHEPKTVIATEAQLSEWIANMQLPVEGDRH